MGPGTLEALVLEVTNTLGTNDTATCSMPGADGNAALEPKAFHVSPFMPWTKTSSPSPSPRTPLAYKYNLEAGEQVFSAHLALSLVP